MWLQLLFLAFAVSIDGFSVGLTFGMRNMKIPFKSIAVISCCSALSLGIAMMVGEFIGQFISTAAAEKTGGIILIILGCWVLYQYFRPEKQIEDQVTEKVIFNFEIKSLGVAINILQKPLTADFDKSGTINGVEALVLGFALSLDAFGAGIGAAMLGISPFILSICIAIMSSLFIFAGLLSGKILSSSKLVQRMSFLPGVLLMIIGFMKL
ncbi:sporulation membrane protein YtaF [Peribacillus cavernae]|uniref:Sporulation membrane protein YtaF n=1 Tax=Peribacillus cavernae TaxID=1674310 RepID=A0A3S0TRA8_9BACI|nr:sporulation membrane protein YtaF [Peribacillus cavernae]MDQ0220092.1 putative sporulation protein YtaF [Peribacillus cavernae]RUQ25457.1 sporulation membrane protein YtaF [Peribacillus cavernae]